jgi:L-lactate permease
VLPIRRLRVGAAIVLLGAVFLPLSECSRRENHPPPNPTTVGQKLFPQTNPDFAYQYAFRVIDFSVAGVLTVVAFVWPLLFVLVVDQRRGSRLRRTFLVIELLLCAGTLYWAHAIMLGGTWMYGAYLVLAAVVLFGCTTLASFFRPEARNTG